MIHESETEAACHPVSAEVMGALERLYELHERLCCDWSAAFKPRLREGDRARKCEPLSAAGARWRRDCDAYDCLHRDLEKALGKSELRSLMAGRFHTTFEVVDRLIDTMISRASQGLGSVPAMRHWDTDGKYGEEMDEED